MKYKRIDSLSPLGLTNWRWDPFFCDLLNSLSNFSIEPCEVSQDFLYKKAITGSNKKQLEVTTSTWVTKWNKIRKLRVACVDGGSSLSVFNLLINPFNNYNLPFFGADFVTLPNGHLLALDLQPALKMDISHTENVWSDLIPIHDRWQALLPFGGPIPKEAEPFFSPGFLWTRLPLNKESDCIIAEVIRPAFREYLYLYIKLINQSSIVSNNLSQQLLEGQKAYINYRSTKDPARAMLTRFYGKDWTEEYINKVLF